MNALSLPSQQLGLWRAKRPPIGGLALDGAIAGLIGGAAMILSAALLAGAKGYDIWFQLKAIASLALGPDALAQAGFAAGPVLAGLAIHLAVAALLGARNVGSEAAVALSLSFGIVLLLAALPGSVALLASIRGGARPAEEVA